MKLDDRQSPWPKRLDRYVGIPLIMILGLLRKVILSVIGRRRFQGLRFQGVRRRILVIKLSALGDAVLMLPALYRIRETNKDAEIIFLGGGSNVEFLKLCKALNHVESFSVKSCLGLLKNSYDLIIDFDQWVRATAILSALCVARQTSGFKTPGHYRHFAYDLALPFQRDQHMAHNFWNLAHASLKGVGQESSSFDSDRENVRRRWGADLVNGGGPVPVSLPKGLIKKNYMVIHPGCGEQGTGREWPLASWQRLIVTLKKTNPVIIVTGKGQREKEWGDALASSEGVMSLVNQLDLRELIMILSQARRIIATNTGVMHLADYLNDSVYVLEGPTDSALWGPLWKGKNILSPLACSPCLTWGHDYGCSDPVCLKAITPDQVFEALSC